MWNDATAGILPKFAISDYAPIDETTLPKDYPAKKRESAEIINIEIARENKRLEKFNEAIELDDKSALAWFNRGRYYLDSKDYRRAIEDFDEAIRLDDTNAQFYNARGFTYFHLNRKDEALKELEGIDIRFGRFTDLPTRTEVARSLVNRALLHSDLVRVDDAFAAFDNLMDRFGNAEEHALRRVVANALLLKGGYLLHLGGPGEALDVLDDVLTRADDATKPDLYRQFIFALLLKGHIFQSGDPELAITIWDDLLARLPDGNVLDLGLRETVALALVFKAQTLYQLRRYDLSLSTWKELTERFASNTNASIVNLLEIAKFSIGIALYDLERFAEGSCYFREMIKTDEKWRNLTQIQIEKYILKYYARTRKEEENPDNGYDLPKRVITEAELREYVKEQAALLTERMAQPEDAPFPLLDERTVKAIIAHGKKHPWDNRREQGWPYHTNVFVFVHITYRKWVNRGLTREILAWVDPALHAHLNTKLSREGGMPEWLDVPSGPEARARAIADPTERAELEIARKFSRKRMRAFRASQGDN